jgi:hypothetical protein
MLFGNLPTSPLRGLFGRESQRCILAGHLGLPPVRALSSLGSVKPVQYAFLRTGKMKRAGSYYLRAETDERGLVAVC